MNNISKALSRCITFLLRLLVEIFVTAFDLYLSRLLMAAVVVAVLWVPCHFAVHTSVTWFVWPTVILASCLCGLWEGCHMFEIRPYFGRLVLFPSESKNPHADNAQN